MCRSLLSPWINENGEKQYLGRSNTGVCTVNLPRVAIESGGNVEKFYEILKERLELAKDVLLWRYGRLITLKAKEAPFTFMSGVLGMRLEPEESVEKVFANGRGSLSIGFIGLHEVVLTLMQKEVAFSKDAQKFQKDVMQFIKKAVDSFKEDTGLGFSVYSTPAEAITDRLCKLDKETFGSIKGVTDKGFYVNSYHVNTEAGITPFEKIDIESEFQPLALGGHIMYIEMHDAKNNPEAYETYVRYAHAKGLMYFAVNSGWDYCKSCHWSGELDISEDTGYAYRCPVCGEADAEKIVVTRRLCGYVSTYNKRPPVEGRAKEIISRIKHKDD